MDARMTTLSKIRDQISTHDCPGCSGPAYCAMEDGKSANLCWCMDVEPTHPTSPEIGNGCLCRRCLTKEVK